MMDTKNIEKQAKKDGIERFVVGAVIINKGSILFVRRAKDDFMGGIYELPSGKVDSGESLTEALKREVLEETNLVIKEIVGLSDTFDYKSKSGVKTRQFNFVVLVEDVNKLRLNPEEHDLFEWIQFKDIETSEILDDMMKSIAKKALQVVKNNEHEDIVGKPHESRGGYERM